MVNETYNFKFLEHGLMQFEDLDLFDFDVPEALAGKDAWKSAYVLGETPSGRAAIIDTEYRLAQTLRPEDEPEIFSTFHAFVESEVKPRLPDSVVSATLTPNDSHIIRYMPGGYFRPHRDACGRFWNRCFTILMYFTSCGSGETDFPELGLSVQPKPGRLIVFPSECLHAGKPVTSGEKLVIATWLSAEKPIWGKYR